jgi:hypothetical protein
MIDRSSDFCGFVWKVDPSMSRAMMYLYTGVEGEAGDLSSSTVLTSSGSARRSVHDRE